MNREILFRGKWNGIWVYGDLRQYSETHIGIYSYDLKQTVKGVDPDTVGQYTGLTDKTDKNGKKIFEGDIVQSLELELKGVIIFDEYLRFMIKDITTNSTYLLARNNEEIKVIGNIHDNPELLKGEQT